MRKKLVAGNWKMNMNVADSLSLVGTIDSKISNLNLKTDVIMFPPFTSLFAISEKFKNCEIGAQNMHHKDNGAFTGEISADMISSCGCKYVLLGHSERRQYFFEDDNLINLKVKKALQANLKPIICVGELLEQRENGTFEKVVDNQVALCLRDITKGEMKNIVIAYEPVWAIGTGKTATPEQANSMHKMIRTSIKNIFGEDISESIRILYGGSVNDKNSAELFGQSDIDGGLIGGASLKADTYVNIILSANNIN